MQLFIIWNLKILHGNEIHNVHKFQVLPIFPIEKLFDFPRMKRRSMKLSMIKSSLNVGGKNFGIPRFAKIKV